MMLMGRGHTQLSLSVSRALFLLYHEHAVLRTEEYLSLTWAPGRVQRTRGTY